MRIAVDARELARRPTGVGRYLEELLRTWHASGAAEQHEIVLYTPQVPERLAAEWQTRVRLVPGTGGTRWEQWDLARALRRDRPDVLFAPGYSAPLTCPAPVALTVHDVSFFAHPEWFTLREGARRRRVTAWSARRAKVVITPSTFSAAEAVRFLGPLEARIRVVPHGIRQPDGAVPVDRERSVLYAGSLFQRRRIDVLVDAFAGLAARYPDARLDIVGENRTSPRVDFGALVARYGIGGQVVFRHWVDDAALEALYRRASVFVFLSQYEGFGLTPLEAMAQGAVPVVLDTAVSREVYGDAAVRLADTPSLARDLEATLERLLTDGTTRSAYRTQAPAVLGRYRWEDAAAETLACIDEASRG